jgi:hypothetical protein
MDKKKILIGVGFLALIGGVSYYFYSKSKKPADTSSTGGDSESVKYTSASQESAPASAPASSSETSTPIVSAPILETRKEKRKACGIRPLFKGKKRTLWERCVAEGGIASFEGDFDGFEETYMDFDNNFDITF